MQISLPTRPLRLTDAGEALARRACAVFEQLAAAEAEIGAILELDAGRLRLGTFSSAGATFVAQALAAFRQRFPGVRVTVMEAGPPARTRSSERCGPGTVR